MNRTVPPTRRSAALAVALVTALAASRALAVSPNIVISQVYGAGGNSGATYNHDYVELFNRGAAAQSLSGWSLQYASATGTGNFASPVALSGTIPAGGYFLVQLAGGATGIDLPAADQSSTSINMAGGAGKILLANTTSAIACNGGGTACTPAQLALFIDLVGWGNANFYEGSVGPATSTTNAIFRASSGCTDTDNNGADFAAAAAAPRNSGTAVHVCPITTNPSGTGAATPSVLLAGESTLLTVVVTPGANPASTSLTVACDATPIGGSNPQAFYDNGTNGDVTGGDNTFSFSTTVAGGTTTGAKALTCVIGDSQGRSGSATVNLNVVTLTKIHDIQGNGVPSWSSPHLGETLTTSGVVTALLSGAFFIQEPDASVDGNPNTSEGLYVYSAPPVGLARGDLVRVTGTVSEFHPAAEPLQPTVTELGGVTFVGKVSSGNPIPSAVTLTAADTSPSGGFFQIAKYDGMRVSIPSMTVVGPTGGSVDEPSAASTSSGWFWGVVTGVARPFREAGANVLDPLPGCVPPCSTASVPRFDGNPERFDVGLKQQVGGTTLDLRAGDVVTGLVGPLIFNTSAGYRAWELFPDPGSCSLGASGPGAAAVPPASHPEFTVASFNVERFFDTADDPTMENSYEAILTATAFDNRLKKASLAIRDYVRYPDILAVAEVENLTTLQAIAAKINADAVVAGDADPQYVAYLVDGSDIDVGFLVKTAVVSGSTPRVSVSAAVAENAGELFMNADGIHSEPLNDRAPLRLMATVHSDNGASFPITVIAIHQRSLSSIDSTSPPSPAYGWATSGERVRAKRRAQARSLAALVDARQVADPDERIVVLGDLNAFEFSDGYVDVTNITTGATPQTADSDVILGNGGSVYTTSPLTDLISTDPAQRYSYVDYGSAQNLDHLMLNAAIQSATLARRLEHARIDADFPEADRNDPDSARRLSDHDPLVGYFQVAAFATADLSVAISGAPASAPPGSDIAYTVTVTNDGPDGANGIQLTDALPAGTTFVSLSHPGGWSCSTPSVGSNGTISCSIASLGLTSAAFTVTLRIAPGTALGTELYHDASVSGTSTDDTPGNEEDGATTVAAAGPAAAIAATGGTPQSSPVARPFPSLLQATVTDGFGNPVQGVTVTFTAPASGATGTFPGFASGATAVTDANGVATSPVITANDTVGGFEVTATASGVTGSALFDLTNAASTAIPALGTAGLATLMILLAGAGMLLLRRLR